MARLLGDGGMTDEARAPEPASLDDALLPPLSHGWKEALMPLRQLQANSNTNWQTASQALATLLTPMSA